MHSQRVLTFALLLGLFVLISAEKPRATSLTQATKQDKQEELRRGWWSDSSSDDDDGDVADDDNDGVASKLSLVSMALHLPITMQSFGEAEKTEFTRIIANVVHTLPEYVFISSVITSARRRLLSSGIQVDFSVAVPNSKTTPAIVSLCPHNLNEAMALSPLPLFSDIEVSVIAPAVLVVDYDDDSDSSSDDDDDHHNGKKWWIGGTTLLLIGGCWWYCRRRGWKCCGCCFGAHASNASETAEDEQPAQQRAAPTLVVAVSNHSSDPAKDQGLCYPLSALANGSHDTATAAHGGNGAGPVEGHTVGVLREAAPGDGHLAKVVGAPETPPPQQ